MVIIIVAASPPHSRTRNNNYSNGNHTSPALASYLGTKSKKGDGLVTSGMPDLVPSLYGGGGSRNKQEVCAVVCNTTQLLHNLATFGPFRRVHVTKVFTRMALQPC